MRFLEIKIIGDQSVEINPTGGLALNLPLYEFISQKKENGLDGVIQT